MRWLIFALTWWAFTPLVFAYARLARDTPGIGGEMLFPLIPLALWGLCSAIREAFKTSGTETRQAEGVKINTTMEERINAQRIIKGQSYEDFANSLDVPVFIIKQWCGAKPTLSEKLQNILYMLIEIAPPPKKNKYKESNQKAIFIRR